MSNPRKAVVYSIACGMFSLVRLDFDLSAYDTATVVISLATGVLATLALRRYPNSADCFNPGRLSQPDSSASAYPDKPDVR